MTLKSVTQTILAVGLGSPLIWLLWEILLPVHKKTLLGCLVCSLGSLSLGETVKPKSLIFYCQVVWLMFKLDNSSQWPDGATFDPCILQDLDNFFHHNSKWSEIPYVQAFFSLKMPPSLLQSCKVGKILLDHTAPPDSPSPPDFLR